MGHPTGRRDRRGSAASILVVVLVGVAVAVIAIVWAVVDLRPARDDAGEGPLRPADVARGTAATVAALVDPANLADWAADTAARTNVPARVLQAYASAEVAQRSANPVCGVSWATLAAIGRVESRHATIGGADLDDTGVADPPIVGIPLDGRRNTREILDSDGGRLDGDRVWDRAVGPMQFLPGTWARFGADGNGDGVRDPQQIDDAALAAAGYLCADGRDLAAGDGWWDAVLTYNRSTEYARLVWAAADRYALATSAA